VIVVADTSCLCYLARLELESVLESLYGSVMIPPAVAAELLAGVSGHPEIDRVLHASWLHIHTLSDQPKLGDFPSNIDPGEAEAMRLAEEVKADYLLMDDGPGRAYARSRNLQIVGILGVLSEACDAGLIHSLRPVYEKLVDQLGFHIRRSIIETILKERGE
jgi:predicted nucleic acid-binding protein